ncbi:MAG: PQQ-dependent sugar dehydrogenase [Candidatus Hydrogenedentota bacterium]
MRHVFPGTVLLAALVLSGCPTAPITIEKVAGDLKKPLYVTSEPEDASRLYILEQNTGRIILVIDGEKQSAPFLDVGDHLETGNLEQGLLGLTFHPDFAENGYFYINYTAPGEGAAAKTVVERYQVSADPNVAEAESGVTTLEFGQPADIHNAGMMAFGPDGYLYIATGDGGPGNDPDNRAQSLDTLLGKILRIDVDGGAPYAIPPDNPFVDTPDARPEIWAYGLRNPWRFSFDRLTGDLYIADVGERAREEVNFEPAGSPGGVNYGWRVREGSICRPGQEECALPGAVDPIYDYDKLLTASITGGYVYRGNAIPELSGAYVFGDYSNGRIWSFRYDGASIFDFQNWSGPLRPPTVLPPAYSSFGEDADGELYIVEWLSGNVYKIVPRA